MTKTCKIRRVIPSSKRIYLSQFDVGDIVEIQKLKYPPIVAKNNCMEENEEVSG